MRSSASGVRSSWPASATKSRSRSSAASSRSSISFSVSPSRCSSSPVGGTGSRSPGVSAEIAGRAAAHRLDLPQRQPREEVADDRWRGAGRSGRRSAARRGSSPSVSASFCRVAPTTSTSRPAVARDRSSPAAATPRSDPGPTACRGRPAALGAAAARRAERSGARPSGGVASRTRPSGASSCA